MNLVSLASIGILIAAVSSCSFATNSGCFVKGTQIATPAGEKNIEDLKVGDRVVSIDLKSGAQVSSEIIGTIRKELDEIYVVRTDSGLETRATGDHPFFRF